MFDGEDALKFNWLSAQHSFLFERTLGFQNALKTIDKGELNKRLNISLI